MTNREIEERKEQTASIAANLKTIEQNGTDLDEIEARLDRIIEKLERVKKADGSD